DGGDGQGSGCRYRGSGGEAAGGCGGAAGSGVGRAGRAPGRARGATESATETATGADPERYGGATRSATGRFRSGRRRGGGATGGLGGGHGLEPPCTFQSALEVESDWINKPKLSKRRLSALVSVNFPLSNS